MATGFACHVPEPWGQILRQAGLDSFEAWWALSLDAVEPGNQRREGWSAVSHYRLPEAAGGGGVFIKRQRGYVFRSLRHPWRGRLTCEREYRVLLRCAEIGVAAAEPLLFAQRGVNGDPCGVLVTRALEGYSALEDCVSRWQRDGWPPLPMRRRLLRVIAAAVRRLHDARLQHNCLYPKHIMVNEAWLAGDDSVAAAPVALIDLEKAKQRLWRRHCARRDLDSLNRRSIGWSRADRRRFLGYYLGRRGRLQGGGRRLWRTLAHSVRA